MTSAICGHTARGFDGGSFTCYKIAGHKGWHEESVRLRDGYTERTNWGDDGLAPHSSKDNARRQAESPSRR